MAKKEQQTYKQALAEAEKILAQIESNELDVDQMADAVKKALELLTFCKNKLRATEENIEKLMENE
jgi:exodeoxyribonuclease VII small subunit